MIQKFTLMLLGTLVLNVSGALPQSGVDGCWIWRPSDLTLTGTCEEWVLYQGDFVNKGEPWFIKRGMQPAKLNNSEPTLLFRLYGMIDTGYLAEQIDYSIAQWRRHGINVNEVQLDYDSPSSVLTHYAALVRALRQRMPQVKFSATALVTWYEDNPAGVTRLAKELDYIAFQLYQDHAPLADARHLVQRLATFPYDYKLGITTHEDFAGMRLATGRNYQGTMLFLNVRK